MDPTLRYRLLTQRGSERSLVAECVQQSPFEAALFLDGEAP